MSFENVHNYYETLVLEEIQQALRSEKRKLDSAAIEDIGCVALNQLPPRYVRHDVDLIFYLTPEERRQMGNAVQDAVAQAIALVTAHTDSPGNNPATT
ncbi:MAG TPA: hypothetical protein ENK35_03355 [Candidatus Tenderia sp.]|nr:hypothetical protein [Candidatus Tenderia sp.]